MADILSLEEKQRKEAEKAAEYQKTAEEKAREERAYQRFKESQAAQLLKESEEAYAELLDTYDVASPLIEELQRNFPLKGKRVRAMLAAKHQAILQRVGPEYFRVLVGDPDRALELARKVNKTTNFQKEFGMSAEEMAGRHVAEAFAQFDPDAAQRAADRGPLSAGAGTRFMLDPSNLGVSAAGLLSETVREERAKKGGIFPFPQPALAAEQSPESQAQLEEFQQGQAKRQQLGELAMGVEAGLVGALPAAVAAPAEATFTLPQTMLIGAGEAAGAEIIAQVDPLVGGRKYTGDEVEKVIMAGGIGALFAGAIGGAVKGAGQLRNVADEIGKLSMTPVHQVDPRVIRGISELGLGELDTAYPHLSRAVEMLDGSAISPKTIAALANVTDAEKSNIAHTVALEAVVAGRKKGVLPGIEGGPLTPEESQFVNKVLSDFEGATTFAQSRLNKKSPDFDPVTMFELFQPKARVRGSRRYVRFDEVPDVEFEVLQPEGGGDLVLAWNQKGGRTLYFDVPDSVLPEMRVNHVIPNVFEAGNIPPGGGRGGGGGAPFGEPAGETVFTPGANRRQVVRFLRGIQREINEGIKSADFRRPNEWVVAQNEFLGGKSESAVRFKKNAKDLMSSDISARERRRVRRYRQGRTARADVPKDTLRKVDPLFARLDMIREDIKAIRPDLAARIDKYGDNYLARLYWAFEDPNWQAPGKVRQKAHAWLMSEEGGGLAAHEADKLLDDLRSGKIGFEELENQFSDVLADRRKSRVAQARRFKKRRNPPPAIRAFLGEIKDGTYLAIRSLADLEQNWALVKFMKAADDNIDTFWRYTRERPWMVQEPTTLARELGDIRIDQETRSLIGEFAHKEIPKWLAEDFVDLTAYRQGTTDFGEQILNHLVAGKRKFQVAYNYGTWMRNIMGNVVAFGPLADMNVMNPANAKFLYNAIVEVAEKGPRYLEALEDGAVGSEFFSTGLRNQMRQIAEEFQKLSSEGMPMPTIWTRIARMGAKFDQGVSGLYDGIDRIFKLATYMKAREVGVKTGNDIKLWRRWMPFGQMRTPLDRRAAAAHVNRFFPNYNMLGKHFKSASRGKGALIFNPFLAFSAESVRIWMNAMAYRPLAAMGVLGGVAALYNLGWSMEGVTPQQWREAHRDARPDRRALPSYYRWPTRLMVQVPYMRDAEGNRELLDLTWIIPMADILYGWRLDPSRSTTDNMLQALQRAAFNFYLGGYAVTDPSFQFDDLTKEARSVPEQWARGMFNTWMPMMATRDVPEIADRITHGPSRDRFGEKRTLGRAVSSASGLRVKSAGTPALIRQLREEVGRGKRLQAIETKVERAFNNGDISLKEMLELKAKLRERKVRLVKGTGERLGRTKREGR